MSPARRRSRVAVWIRLVVGSAAVVFVVWTFAKLIGRVSLDELSVAWGWVVLSLVPLVVGVFVLAYGFATLLARVSQVEVPIREAMRMQIESQLARYTPGKVGVPLVRLAAAEQLGVSRRAMASAMAIEALSFLAVGGGIGLVALLLTKKHAPPAVESQAAFLFPLVGAFAVATLALVFVDRRLFPAFILRALAVEGSGPLAPPTVTLAHAVYWLTWCLHGLCLNRGLGAEYSGAIAGSGLYVLAPILGFLALVAPAGVGVREALLSAGLAPALGPTGAIAAAVLSRIASTIADSGTWLATR